MMKKLYILLTLLVLILTACSASSTSTSMSSTSTDLPIETQLAVGTLKLAVTGQDLTAEQAQELVLLWLAYKQLGESDTAAQAEVDGLIAQIQETMTPDQIQAITEMQLTQQDVFTAMQGATVASDDSAGSTVSLPSSGGMPAGGPPSDGGAPPDGEMPPDMGSGTTTSSTDESQSTLSVTTVPAPLVEAVIQSLQQRIAA